MAVEPTVEAARKLYKKGVEVTSLAIRLRENADLLVHNADTCFISGFLNSYHALIETRKALLSEIYDGFNQKKISASEANEAINAFERFRTNKEDEAIRRTQEVCRCKWRKL